MTLVVVGKRGKMQRKATTTPVLPGAAASSLSPGESPTFVKQWSNGKGRFRKRPFFYIRVMRSLERVGAEILLIVLNGQPFV